MAGSLAKANGMLFLLEGEQSLSLSNLSLESSHYERHAVVSVEEKLHGSLATLLKRRQLQMERDMLDAQLRYLEELEMARRSNGKSLLLTSVSPNTTESFGSKPLTDAAHCSSSNKMSKGDNGYYPSSASSTFELSTSSHSVRKCDDDWQGSLEMSFNNVVVDTVITYDDSHSFCSGITMPLTPQEELDHFISTEIPIEPTEEYTQSQHEEFLEEHEATPQFHDNDDDNDDESESQQQQRQRRRQRRRQRKNRLVLTRPTTEQDDGDAQPGRVRNMPWLIALDDGKRPLRAMYSGPLVKDLPYGIGTFRMANGDMYMGEIVWGAMHGTGTYWSQSDNQVLRGQFVNNVFQYEKTVDMTTKSDDLEEKGRGDKDKEPTSTSRHARKCKRAIRKLTQLLIRLNEVERA